MRSFNKLTAAVKNVSYWVRFWLTRTIIEICAFGQMQINSGTLFCSILLLEHLFWQRSFLQTELQEHTGMYRNIQSHFVLGSDNSQVLQPFPSCSHTPSQLLIRKCWNLSILQTSVDIEKLISPGFWAQLLTCSVSNVKKRCCDFTAWDRHHGKNGDQPQSHLLMD